ncbi:MAG: glycosyltransferase family 2 protein [Chloroflexota bacterium]
MASLILPVFITGVLVWFSIVTILNVFTMLRVGKASQTNETPLISVLIPARNEADVIARTISNLLAQTYTNYEIVLLDDNSTDGTSQQAIQAANGDTRLRIISGKPLPDGWAGKNWACHQLSEAAQGEWLIFTDADVQWNPIALQSVVDMVADSRADMLTVWSTQETHTWGERLVVPLMAFVILGYLPHLSVHHIPWAVFGVANGQCMVFRRKAYEQIGGHAAVSDEIVEDIRLAQTVKRSGLQLRIADGTGLVNCHMYNGWREVRDGYGKNIIAGYGDSLAGLLAGSLFHWVVFLYPWVWLVSSIFTTNWLDAAWALALIALAMLIRALTAAATLQRPHDALLMPVSVLLMTRIAAQGIYWQVRYGGPRWKDRTIVRRKTARTS